MLNKTSLTLLLALLASACTREVYLQRVPCVDCEPEPQVQVEEVCPEEKPVEEVYKVYDQVPVAPVPAPVPVCPTCVVPTCVVYPCPVMVPVCPTCNYTYTYGYTY